MTCIHLQRKSLLMANPDIAPSTLDQAKDLGLLPEEYEKIKVILGRNPNFTELCIYSALWNEHASYKNSIKWLKTLPKKGAHILVEAGEENAGLVDIGGGLACAFKIESHNHPSAIEPYQGAATGVGGINRDIFTMGARPIAQLNSLRFGNPDMDRTKWLVKGVVKGIGDYGNSFGVPVVGGEVQFDDSYNTNPLVNAFSAGIVEVDKTISAVSYGVGNPVYIVGSATGKDGIHGASFASKDITEESSEDLPSVQVGDPFQEKLLLEATLELAQTDAIVGMQDMGAAGLICSSSEMSATKGFGMMIDLDKVPTRQDDMKAFELLLSESQERMLVVVEKGKESVVEAIYDKWDLHAEKIGEVTETGRLHFHKNGIRVADVPAESLVLGGGAPVYEREYKEPAYYKLYQEFDPNSIPVPQSMEEIEQIARFLIGHPNIASKKWVWEQYDSMVGTRNMVTNEPADAALVNIKGTDRGLAMTLDCNSRYVKADPYIGAQIAVAEAARNIVCSGGEPSAITNCLNFGNPYNPESYWQFVNAVKGMGDACARFETPVTGGNVNFYNQSVINGVETPVNPTPTIGMIGLLDKSNKMGLSFKEENHSIFLLGTQTDDLASSEYLYSYHSQKESPAPYFDLNDEVKLQNLIKQLIRNKVIHSAHDVSDGGLVTALLESAMPKEIGFQINSDDNHRIDAFLFGEGQGRIVVSCSPDMDDTLNDLSTSAGVAVFKLGKTTLEKVEIDNNSLGSVREWKAIYENALEKKLS